MPLNSELVLPPLCIQVMGLHHQIQKFQQDVPRNDVTGTFMALHVLLLQLQVYLTILCTSTLRVVNLCVYVCQLCTDLPIVSGSYFNHLKKIIIFLLELIEGMRVSRKWLLPCR